MKNTLVLFSFGLFLFNTSCGLISGEMFRPVGKTDSGSTTPIGNTSASLKPSKFTPIDGGDIREAAVDSQGRRVYVGSFANIGNHARGLISLNMDGTRDASFNEGLGATDSSLSVKSGAFQSDGKLIVVGRFTAMGGVATTGIMRLNVDGTPDPTFAVTGTGFNSSYIEDLAIQSDGKIVVVGDFTNYNGTTVRGVARLNSDGSLDTSFAANTGSGVSSFSVYTVALQADGKILAAGNFTSFNGQASTKRMVRLNSDGSVDTTFNLGGGFDNIVEQVKVLTSGKILVGGRFTNFNSEANTTGIVRLNSDGTRDTGFNSPGFLAARRVYAFGVQSNDKIVIGGTFTGAGHNCLARLETDGTQDTSFDAGTIWDCGNYDWVGGINIRPNGQIVVSGQRYTDLVYYADSAGILLHNSDGSVDSSFPTSLSIGYQTVESTINSPTGTLIAMGSFSWMGSAAVNYIYRETADGEFDRTFVTGTGFDNSVSAITMLSDDSMLVGGQFSSYNSTSVSLLAKILSDGSLDTSFNNGLSGFSGVIVNDIAVQSDGKILVAGNFTSYNGTATKHLVRLNANGSLDTAFDTQLDNSIKVLKVQSDGKILIGGYFSIYKGQSRNRIARLLSNGDLDPGFSVGTGFNSDVNDMQIQTDGKIIAAGGFATYNGVSHKGIIRLLSTGAEDTTFSGTGFDGNVVMTISLQSDGKIVAGGWFNAYGATTANYIARINTDGSLDTQFNTGAGFDSVVTEILPLADGVLLVGGQFFSYQGDKAPYLTLLNSDGSAYTAP